MSVGDVCIISSLILFVPKIVKDNLARYGFSQKLLIGVALGGIAWICFSIFHDIVYEILGIRGTDFLEYKYAAYKYAAKNLATGNYTGIVASLFSAGKGFYATYQGLVYYFTGATGYTITAINAFMAFWGSLTLCRIIYSSIGYTPSEESVFPIILIFVPSVVFWTSSNLKEGLMYWAICQVFGLVREDGQDANVGQLSLFAAGAVVGSLLRPHLIAIWIFCVVLIKYLRPGFWRYGVFFLLMAFGFIILVGGKKGVINYVINGKIFEKARSQTEIIIRRGDDSTFDYGERGPIPIISGAINTMFRPFLWKANKVRSVVAGLEIWSLSLGIMIVWFGMGFSKLKRVLRNPSIWVALLVCIPFFGFFTILPNEGLICRQRIQLYPALLALVAIPILNRRGSDMTGKVPRALAND